MKLQERYDAVFNTFHKLSANPQTELHYQTPFQLLVAVILSAQCTDRRVNLITPRLFKAYPTAKEMSLATKEVILEIIKSVSYPNSKARYLKQTSEKIMAEYKGEVPTSIENLMTLSGVGRKTANVITSILNDDPHMAVDTHVFRLAHRIGLVSKKYTTPLAVEKKLTQHIRKDWIAKAHHWLILHGRYVCTARKPQCSKCNIKKYCRYLYH